MRKSTIGLAIAALILGFQNCSLQTPSGHVGVDSKSSSSPGSTSDPGLGSIPGTLPATQPMTNPQAVQASDLTYQTANTSNLTVPQYNTITVKIWGGGGGGGSTGGNGQNGGASIVVSSKGTLSAGGGAGGGQAITMNALNPSLQVRAGAGGVAAGDGMNLAGQPGTLPTQIVNGFTPIYKGGNGGAPLKSTLTAASGGQSNVSSAGTSATALGGGGGATSGTSNNQPGGGGGGSGAYVERVFVYPEIPVGSTLTISVGAGGRGGPTSTNGFVTTPAGGSGAVGRVEVSIR